MRVAVLENWLVARVVRKECWRAQHSLHPIRVQPTDLSDFLRRRQAAHAWQCGRTVPFELRDQPACRHGRGTFVDQALERYAKLNPDLVSALDSDRFPFPPFHAVSRPEGWREVESPTSPIAGGARL